MRVVVVNEDTVRFHTGILKEEPTEYYCSCARSMKSPRNLELKDGDLFITIPDREYVALLVRRNPTNKKPFQQKNVEGVSIFTTEKYMVWVRFTNSYPSALHYLHKYKESVGDEKYILSVNKIDPITTPSEIFLYESSFGDVFAPVYENYTGETTSGVQQMYTNLKRSSYSTLDSSYDVCWT